MLWEHITGGDIAYAPILATVPPDRRRRFRAYLSNYRARLHTGRIAGWDTVAVPYADHTARSLLP